MVTGKQREREEGTRATVLTITPYLTPYTQKSADWIKNQNRKFKNC
jgi:hypothetical protein